MRLVAGYSRETHGVLSQDGRLRFLARRVAIPSRNKSDERHLTASCTSIKIGDVADAADLFNLSIDESPRSVGFLQPITGL